MKDTAKPSGKVFIVGAGPGADDLITLRALRALRQADVVLYDALISTDLLDQAAESAERIYVGKRCGCHSMKQEEITRLLVSKASEGKTVIRLKGGDPLIFGRGGEEAMACAEAKARRILTGCTHAVLSGPAIDRLNGSKLDEVVVTNTLPLAGKEKACQKIRVLSVAPLLGEAIRRIHNEESVSSLFV